MTPEEMLHEPRAATIAARYQDYADRLRWAVIMRWLRGVPEPTEVSLGAWREAMMRVGAREVPATAAAIDEMNHAL